MSANDTIAESNDVFAELDNPAEVAEVIETPVAEVSTPEPQATPEPQPQVQQPSSDAIPAWRLREEAERRRIAEAEASEMRKRIAEFEASKPPPSVFDDEQGFAKHHLQRGIEPIQSEVGQLKQQLGQVREQFSQMMAVQRFGQDKVTAAHQAMGHALQSGDPEAGMIYQRMMSGSMDPYGDMVSWHQRRSVVSEVGGDLNAFRKKVADEALENALKDSTFLQRAIEAARANAKPITRGPQAANVTSLPSLNRSTAAADSDEPEDVGDVLNQAFGGR